MAQIETKRLSNALFRTLRRWCNRRYRHADTDLDKSLDRFGGKNTPRGILLLILRHTAEHLGQSIAYARVVAIVSPWTEDFQTKPEKKGAPAKDKQQPARICRVC